MTTTIKCFVSLTNGSAVVSLTAGNAGNAGLNLSAPNVIEDMLLIVQDPVNALRIIKGSLSTTSFELQEAWNGTTVTNAQARISTSGAAISGLTQAIRDLITKYAAVPYGDNGLTLADSMMRLVGSADPTKVVKFEVDGLTTGTTRTVTVPDADVTIPTQAQMDAKFDKAGGAISGNVSISGVVSVGAAGAGTTASDLNFDGSSAANYGPMVRFRRGGVTVGYLGTSSAVLGGSSDDLVLYRTNGGKFVTLSSAGVAVSGSFANTAATSSGWASTIQNTGTASAHGLYVNISAGADAASIPLRVDKGGTPLVQVDAIGNLSLGRTPIPASLPTIYSTYGLFTGSAEAHICKNATYNNGWKYDTSTSAAMLNVGESGNSFVLAQAPSGTAGGAITWVSSLTLNSGGNIYVPAVYGYTTANAANMYVFSDGQFARSTSSAKYKKDIETLESEFADKALELRPVWYRSTCEGDNSKFSYYGFIAEEAAKVDPRFVHWKFPTKTVELEPARTETKTVQRQKTVTVQAEQIAVEVIDGQALQVRKVVDIELPVFDYLPVFDTDGNPVLEVAEPAIEAQAEVLNNEGNVVAPAVAAKPAVYRQALHQVPVLEDVTETVEIPAITSTEIDYSGKPEAEGFQYERIVVPLQAVAKRQQAQLAALESTVQVQAKAIAALIARIEALEARA